MAAPVGVEPTSRDLESLILPINYGARILLKGGTITEYREKEFRMIHESWKYEEHLHLVEDTIVSMYSVYHCGERYLHMYRYLVFQVIYTYREIGERVLWHHAIHLLLQYHNTHRELLELFFLFVHSTVSGFILQYLNGHFLLVQKCSHSDSSHERWSYYIV